MCQSCSCIFRKVSMSLLRNPGHYFVRVNVQMTLDDAEGPRRPRITVSGNLDLAQPGCGLWSRLDSLDYRSRARHRAWRLATSLRLIRPPTVIRKAPSGPVPVSIQFWSLYTIFSGWKVISSEWYLWSSIPGKSSGENKIMDSIIQDIYWTRIKANINDLENLLMIYFITFHDLIQDTKFSIFSC